MLKYIVCCLAATVVFISCLKDKGNYEYIDLPRFYVDTAGVKTSFEVYQSQGNVTIDPKLVYDGNTADLTYQWRLYAANGVFDTLSRKKTIDTVVTRPPGTYTLEFEAVQKSGIKALMQYTVVVLSPIPSGWMIAYENAAGNTDVDIVRSPEFITGARDTIMRAVYSFRNGSALPGKPVSIAYFSTGLSHIYTTSGGVKVQNTDFAFVQDFSQMFLLGTPPEVVKPEAFWLGTFNGGILVNNGSVYWPSEGSYVGKVTVDAKGYKAAPFVYSQYAKQGGFYDQLNMRFITIEQQTSQAATYANASPSARFNLNNIGKELLFIERGFGQNPPPAADPYKYAFFKDLTGNGRYLYVINTQTPATPDVAAIDITAATDIQNAKFYAVGNLGPAAFYATASRVYYFQINASGNTISAPVTGFTAPAGEEITSMELLKGHGTFGAGAPTAMDSKFMYIATWNQNQGKSKLYMYETNVTSGVMSAAPLKVWELSGKAIEMSYKVQ